MTLELNVPCHFLAPQAQEQYAAQQAWLAKEMAAAKSKGAKHIFLFGHHPLFLETDDEGEDNAVLGFSTFTTRKGTEMSIPNSYFHLARDRRLPLLRLMKKHGSSYFFSGHWHQNGLSVSKTFSVTNVITSAVGLPIGEDGPGFRLVKVFEDGLEHKYFAFDEMPSAAPSLDPAQRAEWGVGGP